MIRAAIGALALTVPAPARAQTAPASAARIDHTAAIGALALTVPATARARTAPAPAARVDDTAAIGVLALTVPATARAQTAPAPAARVDDTAAIGALALTVPASARAQTAPAPAARVDDTAAIGALALTVPATARAQTAPAPAARIDDTAAIDAVVRDVYAVISGPAGPRDWDKLRALFVPEGRMVPIGDRGPVVLTVQGYIDRAGALMAKEGFYESEVARRVEHYGNVAHVFSTYKSRHAPEGAPFARGINSIQLARVGGQWRVLQIAWQGETAAHPIPPAYLRRAPAK